ncbi:MAG: Actin-binding protein [Candidatus Anoxychlamydiales bacterium]|nr:Actin-binding protein [Candidatus Anoxychlamydiales bacterium]
MTIDALPASQALYNRNFSPKSPLLNSHITRALKKKLEAYKASRASLLESSKTGSLDLSKYFFHLYPSTINNKDETSLSSLHFAVMSGHLKVAQFLIKSGADVNSVNNKGISPLYIAAIKRNDQVVELLLRCGANTNLANNKGNTPLHLATLMGHQKVIELLIKYKANINAVNNEGFTPLQLAKEKKSLSLDHFLLVALFGAKQPLKNAELSKKNPTSRKETQNPINLKYFFIKYNLLLVSLIALSALSATIVFSNYFYRSK